MQQKRQAIQPVLPASFSLITLYHGFDRTKRTLLFSWNILCPSPALFPIVPPPFPMPALHTPCLVPALCAGAFDILLVMLLAMQADYIPFRMDSCDVSYHFIHYLFQPSFGCLLPVSLRSIKQKCTATDYPRPWPCTVLPISILLDVSVMFHSYRIRAISRPHILRYLIPRHSVNIPQNEDPFLSRFTDSRNELFDLAPSL